MKYDFEVWPFPFFVALVVAEAVVRQDVLCQKFFLVVEVMVVEVVTAEVLIVEVVVAEAQGLMETVAAVDVVVVEPAVAEDAVVVEVIEEEFDVVVNAIAPHSDVNHFHPPQLPRCVNGLVGRKRSLIVSVDVLKTLKLILSIQLVSFDLFICHHLCKKTCRIFQNVQTRKKRLKATNLVSGFLRCVELQEEYLRVNKY